MPYTPLYSTQICTHERRPGTTVCLHCRHAARLAARERRRRLLYRGGAISIVALVLVAGGILTAKNLRGRFAARSAAGTTAPPVAKPTPDDSTATPQPVGVAENVPAQSSSPAPTSAAETTARAGAPPLSPILPAGESPLSAGVVATRTDSVVVVSFDLPLVRTRRAAKFESFVRATLPAIYGRGADSVLAHVPDGALAGQGDLISELPTRGMRIPAGNSWEIRLYPEARVGNDGPLIVRYRVSVVSTGA